MKKKSVGFNFHPKVLMNDWLEFHPYDKPQTTDYYYQGVCNKVYALLNSFDITKSKQNVTPAEAKKITCMLVAWFEDVVSETRIWQAFTEQHYLLYGKYLPFYNLEEYYPGEINLQDVQFLLWYYFSIRKSDEVIYSPESPMFDVLGGLIFNIFDDEWEKAPVNGQMKNFLNIPPTKTDYYAVRFIIDWLVLNSYLFFPYGKKCTNDKIRIIEEGRKKKLEINYLIGVAQELHDNYVQNTVTSLLAFRGKQWLANVLGENHPLYLPLLNMGDKKTGQYLYLGHDEKAHHFRHIASGVELNVTLKSLEVQPYLQEEKSVCFIGFVNWMDEWWFSGTLSHYEMNDSIMLEEIGDPSKADLFADVEKKKEALQDFYQGFLEYNHQSPIAFLKDKNSLKTFMDDFYDFYNKKISKTTKEAGKAYDKLRDEKKFPDFPIGQIENDDDCLLVFYNSLSGIEIAFGLNGIIPDKNNPWYDENHDNSQAIRLLADDSFSKELVEYLVGNYDIKNMKLTGQKSDNLVAENLDFISRFRRRERYYSNPLISMV